MAGTNLTTIHVDSSLIPGLAQWVKDLALAVSCGVAHRGGSDLSGSYSSDLTPSLGISICCGCSPKKKKKKKRQKTPKTQLLSLLKYSYDDDDKDILRCFHWKLQA